MEISNRQWCIEVWNSAEKVELQIINSRVTGIYRLDELSKDVNNDEKHIQGLSPGTFQSQRERAETEAEDEQPVRRRNSNRICLTI